MPSYLFSDQFGAIVESAVQARADELLCRRHRIPVHATETCTAWRITPVYPTREAALAEARDEARREIDRNRYEAERDALLAREARAARADAEALAANYRYDVAALMFERDRYFWGNSTSRCIQLPRYEAALKIAQDRAAAARKVAV